METSNTESKGTDRKSRRSARSGWVSVSNGIEFSLVPRSELSQAELAGFYRPEERGKTVVVKEGRLYEVDAELRESAIESGFTDLVAREKKRSRASGSSGSNSAPDDQEPSSISTSISTTPPALPAMPSESQQAPTPSLDDLLPKAKPLPSTIVPDELSLVGEAVAQVEREVEQTRIEREREINSLVGWRRGARRLTYWIGDRQEVLFKRIGTNGISVMLHLVILMLLSCVFLVNEKKNDGVLVVASPTSDEILVEEVQIETETVELTEPTEAAPAETTPVEEVSMEVTEMAVTPDFLASVKGDAIKPPVPNADPANDPGDGTGKSLVKPIGGLAYPRHGSETESRQRL